ncbi:hypothetical protein [Mesorhizobium sp. B2-3-5]|uniref:hypothetical protein n=1 Tax=Mesorhizobium sp. B2-3-5 TaxID=2589958 RepID=UPI0015E3A701|nr:hypothetical protein [Mesorhizobium sp. B2-3-5]
MTLATSAASVTTEIEHHRACAGLGCGMAAEALRNDHFFSDNQEKTQEGNDQ